jgi:fibro-slime domain-containing protein
MKFIPAALENSKGVVMVVALLILLAVSGLGVGMISNASMSSTIAANYKNKLQSFYAADGQVTFLAQQVIDSNQCKYLLATSPSCGGGGSGTNLIQNGDFSGGTNSWKTSYGDGATGGGLIIANNNQAKMQIDYSGPQTYSVQLYQELTLTPGKQYTYSFDISASNKPKNFEVVIESQDVNHTKFFRQMFTTNAIGPDASEHFTNTWTQPAGAATWCKFGIHLGTYNDWDVWVDNVVIIEGAGVVATGAKIDTATVGAYKVIRKMQETSLKCFSIKVESYQPGGSKKNSFRTPLSQYLEIQGGGLVNPYGATCTVPVTFYDFRTDRTNPEFEAPNRGWSGIHTNMVANTLGGNGKPALGTNPHRNYYVKYWFTDWNANGAKGDNTIPYYKDLPPFHAGPPPGPSWTGSWENGEHNAEDQWLEGSSYATELKTKNVGHDTSFKNVVVPDSLIFTQVSGSKYQYNNANFFPLDGKGFEANGGARDWNLVKDFCTWIGQANHNYGFTMELHRIFIKIPGLTFDFEGDDDVWLYINNQLVMDLGGIHGTALGSLNIETLGLTNGQGYRFDFFYCERHSHVSDIKITTNMLIYIPFTTTQRHWKRDYGTLD